MEAVSVMRVTRAHLSVTSIKRRQRVAHIVYWPRRRDSSGLRKAHAPFLLFGSLATLAIALPAFAREYPLTSLGENLDQDRKSLRGLMFTLSGIACWMLGMGLSWHPIRIGGDISGGFFLEVSLALLIIS
jgi:hypothetical protein